MKKSIYIFNNLTTKQKLTFTLIAFASIALSITLFGLLVTILFYLIILSISLSAVFFIYGKITAFLKKNKEKQEQANKKPEDIIINAEVISVEVNDKEK